MILVKDIIEILRDEIIQVYGSYDDVRVRHIKPCELVDSETLDWINTTKLGKQHAAEISKAKVLLVDKQVEYSDVIKSANKILIQVKSPRLAISYVAQKFFAKKYIGGIHNNAVIHPHANIAPTAFIGPGCVIGICNIGAGTVLQPNVTIYDNVTIGENCMIQAGVVIGTDGLGCQRLENGTLVKFPHIGGVEIGNDVEIGANSQIARGALSNTIINNGVKINGLCFIAHNCVLEENVWITGNTMLAGSVTLRKNVTIFSSVIIREHCVIGEKATVGMGSVVTKNIPQAETWIGNPAKKYIR